MLDLRASADDYGKVRLISEFDLERHDGWVVLAMVQEPGGYVPDDTPCVVPTTTTKFLIGLPKDATVLEAIAKAKAAESTAKGALRQAKDARDEEAKTIAEMQRVKELVKKECERQQQLQQRLEDKSARLRRYERELGACREFFGHAQMEQALSKLDE